MLHWRQGARIFSSVTCYLDATDQSLITLYTDGNAAVVDPACCCYGMYMSPTARPRLVPTLCFLIVPTVIVIISDHDVGLKGLWGMFELVCTGPRRP